MQVSLGKLLAHVFLRQCVARVSLYKKRLPASCSAHLLARVVLNTANSSPAAVKTLSLSEGRAHTQQKVANRSMF